VTKKKIKLKIKPPRTLGAPAITAPLPLAAPPSQRKLDLACGQVPRPGFEGVDIWTGAQHVVDLQKFPWPFETSSIEEAYCSHYVEHIPHYPPVKTADGRDQNPFFAFFDELWRILEPGAWATIVCPNARSNRGFQDPTHQRFIVGETFLYLNAEFREVNKLDHYNVACNFAVNAVPTVDASANALHPEAQHRHFNNYWNTIHDWVATIQAVKPNMPAQPRPAPKLG
jgi:hypothetical protein